MHKNYFRYPPIKVALATTLLAGFAIYAFSILAGVEMARHWPSALAIALLTGLVCGVYAEKWLFPRMVAKREARIREAIAEARDQQGDKPSRQS